MNAVFREVLEREAEVYQNGVDVGFKNGYAEGCRAAWRKLFWITIASSFVGSLLSLTAVALTTLIHV